MQDIKPLELIQDYGLLKQDQSEDVFNQIKSSLGYQLSVKLHGEQAVNRCLEQIIGDVTEAQLVRRLSPVTVEPEMTQWFEGATITFKLT